MTAVSLKWKYALPAAALGLMSVFGSAWLATSLHERSLTPSSPIVHALGAVGARNAQTLALAVAVACQGHTGQDLSALLSPLIDSGHLAQLSVTSRTGAVLFSWQAPESGHGLKSSSLVSASTGDVTVQLTVAPGVYDLALPSPEEHWWHVGLLLSPLLALIAAGGAGTFGWRWGAARERTLAVAQRDNVTLHRVLDSLDDAVFVTGLDGRIQHTNSAASQLLGASESQIVGHPLAQILTTDERGDTHHVHTRGGASLPVSFKTLHLEDASGGQGHPGDVVVVRDLTQTRRTRRRLRYLASHDILTKLPNRSRFHRLLSRAIERSRANGHALALLYVDLDHFREVNNTLGHRLGDLVVQRLSSRLARTLPRTAVLGRLAGDELALFIEELPAEGAHRLPLAQLARTALDEIGRVLAIEEHEIFLTASMGIALFPRDGETAPELIRNADAALLQAKQEGGNTYAFYVPQMNAQADERVMLKGKLRLAVERDELVIRYQPKVDLRDGRIVGAEALLRWRLPDQGDIPPARFIPLAEESNLIHKIGFWVISHVCQDYREMQGHGTDPGRISINLSLRQLRQASFLMRARSVFRRCAVAPENIELEITESTLMADGPRTIALLRELAGLGLHLSIDDFGTGYSSLAALRQYPIDTVKIDQSFVRHVSRDEADAAIVRTIIAMGRSLGFDVLAEGVESRAQLAFLRDNGCYLAQGRLFGEPLSTEELKALLARQGTGPAPFAPLLHSPEPAHAG